MVAHFGRPFVKRFALRYGTVVCLSSCLSVTLVYREQTVGWIKMPLGREVDFGPGHIVVGDPAPSIERCTAGPTFRPMFIVVKRSPISATAELLLTHIVANGSAFVPFSVAISASPWV